MLLTQRRTRRRRLPGPAHVRLQVEALEPRRLLALAVGPPLPRLITEAEPNDTLDQAQNLGDLNTSPAVAVTGIIGNSPAAPAGVDWYHFRLDGPTDVQFTALASATDRLPPVLSLYVADPFNPGDPATQLGDRQLTQAAGIAPGGVTYLDRGLAAGNYFVAVSGAGNRYFHPFLAGSGYDGQTGAYRLDLAAAPLAVAPGDGPVVLASAPADGAAVDRSPEVIRLSLSAPIDPGTVVLGDNVRLIANPSGNFGDGNDMDVPLAAFNFSDAAVELQLSPAAPLPPGAYRVLLGGNSTTIDVALATPDGIGLGTDVGHPTGRDLAVTFQVTGVEGNTAPGAGADDTPTGAHQLGDVTATPLVQVAGSIGDDPTDPVPFNPADVDLYHFQVSGPGRYAFAAEVFAQRIGSPLNPAVSLFVQDPSDGRLHLLAANDDTMNPVKASNHHTLPLFADPAVFAGLTAGDYYVAVSSHKNVPDLNRGVFPGDNGVFDPEVSHSATAGTSVGDYVLNLGVRLDDQPPQIVAADPAPGAVLDTPPTELTVTFSEPVDLQQLAFRAYAQTQVGSLGAVSVGGPNGTVYFPRLEAFDPAIGQASFLLLDRLRPGSYALRLSGPDGLTDLAGNPLLGNRPDGSYVVPFTVSGVDNGPPYTERDPNDLGGQPQDLGVLFPHELQGNGVAIARRPPEQPAPGAPDTGDTYRFQVLQAQNYFLLLGGGGLPAGIRLTLTDAQGKSVVSKKQADKVSLLAFLQPGSYQVRVDGWTAAASPWVRYTLRLVLGGSPENPQPLALGPAPILRLQLALPATPTPPPAAPPPAPPVTPPASAPHLALTPATPAPAAVVPVPLAVAAPAPESTAPVLRQATDRLVRLPADLLAALGAGPLGGVTPATPTGDRPGAPLLSLGNLSGPRPSTAVSILAVNEKTPTDGGGNQPGEGPAGNPSAALFFLPRVFAAACPALLDLAGTAARRLGVLYQWMEVLLRPLPVLAPAPGPGGDSLLDDPETEDRTPDPGPGYGTQATRPPGVPLHQAEAQGLIGPMIFLGLGCVLVRSAARWRLRRSAIPTVRPRGEEP
jgi:methionine-rich copper-binding protein CopC